MQMPKPKPKTIIPKDDYDIWFGDSVEIIRDYEAEKIIELKRISNELVGIAAILLIGIAVIGFVLWKIEADLKAEVQKPPAVPVATHLQKLEKE